MTNAASETIDAKIRRVKCAAQGFWNKQNFINAICFYCDGLDSSVGVRWLHIT